jgi:DNA-binding transcriptional ArsR family regulator
LGDVLGHTRATLLGQLDLPMTTTQLATLLSLTAPTVNAHLKLLQAAGLVSARRDGRSILYVRTDLGERLLAGSPGRR